jgi:hypothetical protein
LDDAAVVEVLRPAVVPRGPQVISTHHEGLVTVVKADCIGLVAALSLRPTQDRCSRALRVSGCRPRQHGHLKDVEGKGALDRFLAFTTMLTIVLDAARCGLLRRRR